jgi:hypothetical protein
LLRNYPEPDRETHPIPLCVQQYLSYKKVVENFSTSHKYKILSGGQKVRETADFGVLATANLSGHHLLHLSWGV